MVCTHCGNEVENDAVVCPHCGSLLSENAPQQQAAPQQQQVVYVQQPAPVKQSNGLAVAGFVLSLFGATMLIGFILSIVGLVKSKSLGGAGKGFAIAGIVIGCLYFGVGLITILSIFVLPAILAAGASAALPLAGILL